MIPRAMEWSRHGSPWSPVPVALPLWSRFTPHEQQTLAEGGTVERDTGTTWRVPAEVQADEQQLSLF